MVEELRQIIERLEEMAASEEDAYVAAKLAVTVNQLKGIYNLITNGDALKSLASELHSRGLHSLELYAGEHEDGR